jgi:DNA-directed RNA polymerase specialized sigma24 family protein
MIFNNQKGWDMMGANKLSQPEIREKLTSSILQLLALLPEAHRNIFIWKHYYGWPESQIASRLGCSTSEVENTLDEIGRTLSQRVQAILGNESTDLEQARQPDEFYATCHAYFLLVLQT